MPDTLKPATLNVTVVRGDTFTGARLFLEGNTAATATAPDLSLRTFELVVEDDDGNTLASITETPTASGQIDRNADATTGLLRWTVARSVTLTWPVSTCRLHWWLRQTVTATGQKQTVIVGEIEVLEGIG